MSGIAIKTWRIPFTITTTLSCKILERAADLTGWKISKRGRQGVAVEGFDFTVYLLWYRLASQSHSSLWIYCWCLESGFWIKPESKIKSVKLNWCEFCPQSDFGTTRCYLWGLTIQTIWGGVLAWVDWPISLLLAKYSDMWAWWYSIVIGTECSLGRRIGFFFERVLPRLNRMVGHRHTSITSIICLSMDHTHQRNRLDLPVSLRLVRCWSISARRGRRLYLAGQVTHRWKYS